MFPWLHDSCPVEKIEASLIVNAIKEAELATLFAKLGLDAEGNPVTTINVTVEGNVTTAEDLAEVITDIQYTYQKTGKGLLLQSRAI